MGLIFPRWTTAGRKLQRLALVLPLTVSEWDDTYLMIDQRHVEGNTVKETVRISIFHLVLNWVKHQRQLLALVKPPIIHPWSELNRENTSVTHNTDCMIQPGITFHTKPIIIE